MGLPGNPLAACVALMTLAQPLLGALTGSPRSPVPRDTVVLTADEAPRKSDVHRLLPARRSPDGLATVLPSCGSAMLRGLAQADGLLVLPPGGGRAGDSVAFLRLPWDADTGGC
jgi:molybdopterin molybdotransferase